jgi:uncharacterized membrane protein
MSLSPIVIAHMVPAVAAVPLGAYVVASRGGRWHKPAGRTWAALMLVVAATSFWITGLNGARWSPIHLLSVLTLLAIPYAVWRVRRGEVKKHRHAMTGVLHRPARRRRLGQHPAALVRHPRLGLALARQQCSVARRRHLRAEPLQHRQPRRVGAQHLRRQRRRQGFRRAPRHDAPRLGHCQHGAQHAEQSVATTARRAPALPPPPPARPS